MFLPVATTAAGSPDEEKSTEEKDTAEYSDYKR